MFTIYLFIAAIIFTLSTIVYKRYWQYAKCIEVFLSYIFLFNVGFLGIIAAFGHIFMGPEIAKQIGFPPGSPFQFEVGIANLAFGVVGILAFWKRGNFWDALVIGWSILMIGCFIGHLIEYFANGNTAPYNIGIFIWFNDLFLPLFILTLLSHLKNLNRE